MVMPLEKKFREMDTKKKCRRSIGNPLNSFSPRSFNSKHPIGIFPEGRQPQPAWQLSLLVGNVIIFPPELLIHLWIVLTQNVHPLQNKPLSGTFCPPHGPAAQKMSSQLMIFLWELVTRVKSSLSFLLSLAFEAG